MTREEHTAKIDEMVKENHRMMTMLCDQNDRLLKLSNMRDDAEESYQRGLHDAWECARKIALSVEDGGMRDVFNVDTCYSIFIRYSAQEVIKKIDEYEKQKDEIKVGDEVIAYPGISNSPFVVIMVNEEAVYGIDASGLYRGCARSEADFTKTGRSFPEIAEAMKAIRGGTES